MESVSGVRVGSWSGKFWKSRSWSRSRTFYLRLGNPGYVSLQTQGRVYAAREGQCTAAGGEFFKYLGVVVTSDRWWWEEIDTRIGKANA